MFQKNWQPWKKQYHPKQFPNKLCVRFTLHISISVFSFIQDWRADLCSRVISNIETPPSVTSWRIFYFMTFILMSQWWKHLDEPWRWDELDSTQKQRLLDISNWTITAISSEETRRWNIDRVFIAKARVNWVEKIVRLKFAGIVEHWHTRPTINLEWEDLWQVATNSQLLKTFLWIQGIVYLSTDSSNTIFRWSWIQV